MILKWVVGGFAACSFAVALAQGGQQPQSSAGAQPAKSAQQRAAGTTNPAMETAGEQKFQQNCSRCHNAPQELSPRIAGTV